MSREYHEAASYADLTFGAEVSAVDPLVNTLIKLEEERQNRRLILIPSESYAPRPVREALGSVFTNIYAEGYPPSQMVGNDEDLLADLSQQLAYYRRYADRRFYKGADYVHFVETLAQRRVAACFANERVSQDEIFVNVQPLSGASANLAAYDALMEPGDTLMGMDLFQGGHLTHGSEFNVSGRRYEVVSYGVSRKTSRLDYDEILHLAEETQPKVIVAGYTSYPWAPDFVKFREIADSVGAYLVADIAHPAGMAIAGQYPSPVGIADVVTFTTHKTICGPRGACIITTDEDLAAEIDQAVFPGLQGGPHTNKFVAMCVAFEIARTEAFRDLQCRIVENAQALAKGLTDRGLKLAYGGTDTHLLLVDLKGVEHPNKQPLYGEVVARILELAGIVVNKNTVPWDDVTALATGIRMGTPWVTQRSMGPEEMDRLADCIAGIIYGITPFYYEGLLNRLPRGKIDSETLEEVKWAVSELACGAEVEIESVASSYPHYCILPPETEIAKPLFSVEDTSVEQRLSEGVALVDLSDMCIVRVSGWRAMPFLNEICTADVAGLEIGQGCRTYMLDGEAQIIDDVTVWRTVRDRRGRDEYLMLVNPENADRVVSWMRGLSDGYVVFDREDVWRKVQGPATVKVLSDEDSVERMAAIALHGPGVADYLSKALATPLPKPHGVAFESTVFGAGDDSLWVSTYNYSAGADGYAIFGSFQAVKSTWETLRQDGADLVSRQALRIASGIPGVWHTDEFDGEYHAARAAWPYAERFPELFELHKPYFVGQNRLPAQEGEASVISFSWTEPVDATPQRTPLYDEHVSLGAKMVPFAGWEMPVWYSSVGEEHRAVREAAGLFDVAHMGTLEISGPHAADFLDVVSVNYARWIGDGESHYAAFLDENGQILDDIWVYRRAWDKYFLVVNAANFDKDWAWLNAVNRNEVILDRDRPWVRVLHPAMLRNLKDPSSGADQRVDIALQGPKSLETLLSCADDPGMASRLKRLKRTNMMQGELGGIDLLIGRTGYTGEDVAYEIYVHPDKAVALWRMLLDAGEALGVKPCGLASRDSTRIEAGLPLYGHDLAGPLNITQSEAGFAAYVKYHKPFFVGRTPYKAYNDATTRQLVRFGVTQPGARAIRGGEHGEPVANKRGKIIGTVTSCTLVGERQVGLALVEDRYTEPETELFIYPQVRGAACKQPGDFRVGDTTVVPVPAVVLTRFPESE